MRAALGSWGLVLLATLVLGVAGASGRVSATTTTVRMQVVGLGTVKDGQLLQCGNGQTSCRRTYSGTVTETFVATPETDWTFEGWTGDCTGADPDNCTVSLDPADDDYEVIATFGQVLPPPTSTVAVTTNAESAGDGGNVSGGDIDCDAGSTGTCDWTVPTGSTITLVETPETGSVFDGWGGSCSGTSQSCTLTVSGDRSVTAPFRRPKLTVQVTGGGTVSGGGIACTSAGGDACTASVSAGTLVALTAIPDAGGSFTGWSGACSSADPVCTVTLSGDASVTARFSGQGAGTGTTTTGTTTTTPTTTTPSGTTFPLSVSVSGLGTVTGGGLNCGDGGTVCSANEPAGSSVTLVAAPTDAATFTRWGGACSGTDDVCRLEMTSAKSVTATFSGGSAEQVALTVSVSGRGSVTGGGIRCGNGATACTAREARGSTVGLTATPAAGGAFIRWGGACAGTTPTCTVQMTGARSVSATFRGAGGAAPAGGEAARAAVLKSRGRPVVTRTRAGFKVTLRFRTNRRGVVRVRALRAGRLEAALSFTAPSGAASVGPIGLAKPGFYGFDLTQGGRALHWGACLGKCAEAARRAGPFRLARGQSAIADAGELWSVTLRFRSTQPAGADLRIFRGRRLAREVSFASGAGSEIAGPLLLSPGNYTLRLTAIDAYGRVRTLTWVALLP